MVQSVELCLAKNSARTSGPAYNKVTRLLRKSLILHSLVIFGRECVQERQTCSIGGRPIGVKVRSPLAWVASVEETKLVKPTDKAIVKEGERVTGLQRK